jgi:hypothetical protein
MRQAVYAVRLGGVADNLKACKPAPVGAAGRKRSRYMAKTVIVYGKNKSGDKKQQYTAAEKHAFEVGLSGVTDKHASKDIIGTPGTLRYASYLRGREIAMHKAVKQHFNGKAATKPLL